MLAFLNNFYDKHADTKTNNEIFARILNEREKGVSGYYALPFENKACEDIASFCKRKKELLKSVENIILIGIGGSSLGTKAIYHLLRYVGDGKDSTQDFETSRKNPPKIIFLEHTDALIIPHAISNISLDSTLFMAISKSGSTIETASLLKYVIARFGLLDSCQNKEHLLCITDEGSALQDFANKEGVECLSINPSVGGRFSVLSAVGLTPLALLGFNASEILRGAREFMEGFFARKEEHILTKASFFAKHYETYPITTLFSYSSIFKEFNAWFVQLWGESLGKIDAQGKAVGLSPVGLIGSIDQHSFLQLIIEGRADKSVTFLSLSTNALKNQNLIKNPPKIPRLSLHSIESSDFVNGIDFSELLDRQRVATFETLDGLEDREIPLDSIMLNELSEASVGALIAYFELLTSAVGTAFGINTYDQPAVELGKKRLKDGFTNP